MTRGVLLRVAHLALSCLMINVCVDAVVREWLCQTFDTDAARGFDNWVANVLVMFYVDNGLVASWNPVWLQE